MGEYDKLEASQHGSYKKAGFLADNHGIEISVQCMNPPGSSGLRECTAMVLEEPDGDSLSVDEALPNDALSRARSMMTMIVRQIKIAPEYASLPAFKGHAQLRDWSPSPS